MKMKETGLWGVSLVPPQIRQCIGMDLMSADCRSGWEGAAGGMQFSAKILPIIRWCILYLGLRSPLGNPRFATGLCAGTVVVLERNWLNTF